MLLPPLEVTHGRLQESDLILEPPEAPIAVVAEKAAESSCTMVVVDRQPAHPTTTTPVSFPNPADGALTILLVEKCLVILGGKTPSAYLTVLANQNKAGATAVFAVPESRKLLADFLHSAALAHRHALAEMSVLDSVESGPGQVGSHRAERRTRPSGNFTDREATAEQVSDLVQSRYLKRKQ
jgi:hypothetical protein